MYENNCLLVFFCDWIEPQKLKTQKLKCYVLGPKSQKFPTAENTRYTVYICNEIPKCLSDSVTQTFLAID